MSYKLFSVFVLLAILFTPVIAYADKPTGDKPNGSQSNPDDNGHGPERNDNDPGRIDSDDESSKPNGKNDNGSGNEADGDCDDNEGNCKNNQPDNTPEIPNMPMPELTPTVESTPMPEIVNTPVAEMTPTPEVESTPETEIITTTLAYTDSTIVFPETGGCEDCNICEKLDTIISQNETVLANQQIMINLLSKLVNWLIGNK